MTTGRETRQGVVALAEGDPMGSMSSIPSAPKLRVLIVDDDPAALASLEGVLSAEHDVVASISPRRALDLARSEAKDGRPFDVVCSDFRMREMDGGELLRHIADLPQPPSGVLITGYKEVLTGKHRESEYILGIVVKPCDPAELIRLIGRLGRVTRMNRSIQELTAARASHQAPDSELAPLSR